ncbi:MAG TPA: hypothetical protein VNU26_00770, partial [Mycobacteriales bacterium]|nr:hypothetical protein [Mycobacteriales bacterium]
VASPASAAPAPSAGVYAGNLCGSSSNWSTANAGAEACVFRNGGTSSWISLTVGAADYARDGLSAKADVWVRQLDRYGNQVGSTVTFYPVINSSGYATTRIGYPATIYKHSGVTAVRLTIRACTYDSPTKVHHSCATQHRTLTWG